MPVNRPLRNLIKINAVIAVRRITINNRLLLYADIKENKITNNKDSNNSSNSKEASYQASSHRYWLEKRL